MRASNFAEAVPASFQCVSARTAAGAIDVVTSRNIVAAASVRKSRRGPAVPGGLVRK
jgi:hypothetical protein